MAGGSALVPGLGGGLVGSAADDWGLDEGEPVVAPRGPQNRVLVLHLLVAGIGRSWSDEPMLEAVALGRTAYNG